MKNCFIYPCTFSRFFSAACLHNVSRIQTWNVEQGTLERQFLHSKHPTRNVTLIVVAGFSYLTGWYYTYGCWWHKMTLDHGSIPVPITPCYVSFQYSRQVCPWCLWCASKKTSEKLFFRFQEFDRRILALNNNTFWDGGIVRRWNLICTSSLLSPQPLSNHLSLRRN